MLGLTVLKIRGLLNTSSLTKGLKTQNIYKYAFRLQQCYSF